MKMLWVLISSPLPLILWLISESNAGLSPENDTGYFKDGDGYTETRVFHHKGKFGKEYKQVIGNSSQHVWNFGKDLNELERTEEELSFSVYVEVEETAVLEFPLMFQVGYKDENLQFSLPMKSTSGKIYQSAHRTLCLPVAQLGQRGIMGQLETRRKNGSSLRVTVSSSDSLLRLFKIFVKLENNLVRFDQTTTVQVSSNSPALFKLQKPWVHSSRYALLRILASDDKCMTVSIQSLQCPVLDQENNVNFQGVHHTMNQVAAITLKISDLQQGRQLVFVMHEDDSDCDSSKHLSKDHVFPELSKNTDVSLNQFYNAVGRLERTKTVEFVLVEKITDEVYLNATLGPLCLLVGFAVVFGVLFWKVFRVRYTDKVADKQRDPERRKNSVRGCSTSTETMNTSSTTPITTNQIRITNDEEDVELCCCFFLISHKQPYLSEREQECQSNSSSSRRPNSFLNDSCKKCSRDISKSARRYAGTLFVVAAFYTLPVLQFVLLYQRVLAETGNEDLCYHNFLCYHPLGSLAAFNHIFSNIGYVILGLLFLGIVHMEERQFKEEHQCGIHAHFGIFYAMGSALMMQGLLSALYHVCPTHLSFQFDTFFMYVTAVLCIVKIYQARHPDSSASAFVAFGSLAFILCFVLTTIIFQAWYFWMLITIVHILLVFMLSVHVYSFGEWKFDCRLIKSSRTFRDRVYSICLPLLYMDCMTGFLILANVVNWILAGLGVILFYKYGDVSSHFLFIFLMNLALYFVIYLGLKLKNGERILWPTKFYMVISVPIWVLGIYTFSNWPANWELSQAESRTLNTECVLLQFYDIHDVWHFLSAFGMFFMFMFFLTLDDDLKVVKRSDIKVF